MIRCAKQLFDYVHPILPRRKVKNFATQWVPNSFGKKIPLHQEMPGQLRIITEDRHLIARIFDKLNDLMKNKA